ncbi:MAG: pyrroline-5-carboxylate reductase family protein, partial [Gammaproteobacteria bacterium]
MTSQIAFIGGGNMGRAMIGGLIERGHPRDTVWVADPNRLVSSALTRDFGINEAPDNPAAALAADIVVFAVKPQQMADTVGCLGPALAARQPLVVSIAAGITTAS